MTNVNTIPSIEERIAHYELLSYDDLFFFGAIKISVIKVGHFKMSKRCQVSSRQSCGLSLYLRWLQPTGINVQLNKRIPSEERESRVRRHILQCLQTPNMVKMSSEETLREPLPDSAAAAAAVSHSDTQITKQGSKGEGGEGRLAQGKGEGRDSRDF